MKAALLVGIIWLTTSISSYGIGRPHNLFAARKAILERRAAAASNRAGTPSETKAARGLRDISRYSYIFSPRFSQMPHVRE
ncbi:hypothetical protein J2I47_15320 [Fibrella sp. HMF5335]|uniref:Uncharacterized protein n=1 Tax=Fibrella rubiginis TaxID=2817060 RepID=A0A939GJI5_9BACT|nr:hypothetical protein [Fibrella rubiginis]MBO0937926.1 hypothetical protein [Fibrella rubiginis]